MMLRALYVQVLWTIMKKNAFNAISWPLLKTTNFEAILQQVFVVLIPMLNSFYARGLKWSIFQQQQCFYLPFVKKSLYKLTGSVTKESTVEPRSSGIFGPQEFFRYSEDFRQVPCSIFHKKIFNNRMYISETRLGKQFIYKKLSYFCLIF